MFAKKIASEGTFPSIVYDPVDKCVRVAWQLHRTVGVVDLDPTTLATLHVQSWDVLGAEAAHPELGFADGRSYIAWRDGAPPYKGHLRDLELAHTQTMEPFHGSRPCAFGDGFFAWINDGAAAGWPVQACELRTGVDASGTYTRNAAGTGLSHIDKSGTWCQVTTIDEARGAFPGITDPSWVDTAVVGATDIDGQPALRAMLFANEHECIIAKGEVSKDPRMCTDGTAWFITAWSDIGEGIRIWRVEIGDFVPVSSGPGEYDRTPHELSRPEGPRYLGHYHTNSKHGEYFPDQNCPVLGVGLYKDGDGHIPHDAKDRVAAALRRNHMCILAAERDSVLAVKDQWSKVAALIIGEMDTPDQVRSAVRKAHDLLTELGLPQRPVMSTLTVNQTVDAKYNGTADWAGVELYFDAPAQSYSEMEAQVMQRVSNVLSTHTGPVMFIVQSYDRSNPAWTDGMLEAIQWAAHEEMCEWPHTRVLGCIWFSYARPTGVLDHPILQPWHDEAWEITDEPPIKDDSTDPPPQENDMTHDDMRRYIAELHNNVLFGAYQRLHNEVLPRDRPMDGAIKSEAWTGGDLDFWTGDVVTGGASAIFNRVYIVEYCIARDKGRTMEQASGDGYDAAKKSYDKAVGNPQ